MLIFNHNSIETNPPRDVLGDGIEVDKLADGAYLVKEFDDDGRALHKVGRFTRTADAWAALDSLDRPNC